MPCVLPVFHDILKRTHMCICTHNHTQEAVTKFLEKKVHELVKLSEEEYSDRPEDISKPLVSSSPPFLSCLLCCCFSPILSRFLDLSCLILFFEQNHSGWDFWSFACTRLRMHV